MGCAADAAQPQRHLLTPVPEQGPSFKKPSWFPEIYLVVFLTVSWAVHQRLAV